MFGSVPHPKPAIKMIPSWYRKMDKTFSDESNGVDWSKLKGGAWKELNQSKTMKSCLPVRDYITSGYIIPAWKDLMVGLADDGQYIQITPTSEEFETKHGIDVDWHGRPQFEGSPLASKVMGESCIKINNPWIIKTPTGYSSLIFSPFYHDPEFQILPAIVDTDTLNLPINLPCVLKSNEALLKRGTPFVQVVPFKRENWSHEVQAHPEGLIHKLREKLQMLMTSPYNRELWQRKYFR